MATINHNDAASQARSEETPTRFAVRRRDRKPLSCMFCRAKKLRCDRAVPACSNCRSRPGVLTCDYSSSGHYARSIESNHVSEHQHEIAVAGKDNFGGATGTGTSIETLQAKVDRLERTIQHLTAASHRSPSPALPRESEAQSSHMGVAQARSVTFSVPTLSVPSSASPETSAATGDPLWATLLRELAENQTQIPQRASPPLQASKPTSLFAASSAVPQADILLHIPSRYVCDKIVAAYFSHQEPTRCLLHQPTFWEQYEDFWQRPSQTPIMWLALLFGILRIVVGAWLRESNEPAELQGKCSDMEILFRHRAGECLTHADYASPQEFLLEALLLHLYVVYSASRDFHSSVWVQYGLILRLSIRLGYHLDPNSLRDVTPFRREMRRRVWTFIRQADLLFSYQIGLPSILHPRWLEGQLPHNLHDDDFGPRCNGLPPPKPDSETTSVSYMIAKSKLVFGFARALAELGQDGNLPYTRILGFDSELRSIYQSIPKQYQVHDLADLNSQDSLSDGLRLVLGAIYHKALCVIHAKFLKAATTDQQYLYSWLVCLNSALTITTFQSYLDQHLHTGRKWVHLVRYQHSLTIHDFFLAATILCTSLFLIRGRSTVEQPICVSLGPSEEEMFTALEKSIAVFERGRSESAEANRASQRLGSLVRELRLLSHSENADRSFLQVRPSHTAIGPTPCFQAAPNQCVGSGDTLCTYDTSNNVTLPVGTDETSQSTPQLSNDWDATIFGLDLCDPISFAQTLHSQDDYFIQ